MLPPHLSESLPLAVEVDIPGRGSAVVWDSGPNDEGPPVLLLHGWNVDGPLNWAAAWPQLSESRRVVMFDVHGHGNGIRSTDRFRFEHCATDVLAIADQLGIDEFVMCGYSMGGAIAQIVARRAPDRVAALALVATAATFSGRKRERVKFVALGTATRGLRAMPRVVQRGIHQAVARTAARRYPNWVRPVVLRGDPVSMLEAGTNLGRFDSTRWVGDLDVPTVCVVTGLDTVVAPSRQRALAERLDAPTFVVAAGHDMPVREHPDFGPTMVAALDEVAPVRVPAVVV